MRLKRIILLVFGFIFLVIISNCTVDKLFATIQADSNIYFDETETSVFAWLTYYTWVLEHEGEVKANRVLPDSNAVESVVWQYIRNKRTKKSEYTYLNTKQTLGYFYANCDDFSNATKIIPPSYLCPILELPITGITYEQALAFCKWRTKITNENPSRNAQKSMVVYRLPTEKEWYDFTKKGLSEKDLKNGYYDSISVIIHKNKKNATSICTHFNYKTSIPCDCYTGTIAVRAHYYTGKKAIGFDLFGNVSEMTSTKGVAKGGNYLIYANQCNIDSIQHYTKPEKWLGFRCVAVKD